jgi:two-component system response regulator YesN
MIKVIVVEDEDVIRKGFIHSVDWASMGCSIIDEASNGKDGLDKILKHRPDLVFVDIKMPGMDGLQMLKTAGKDLKFKAVILSSHAKFEDAQEAIRCGVVDYLLKPVDNNKLKALMAEVKIAIRDENSYYEYVKNKNELKASVELLLSELPDVSNKHVAEVVFKINNNYYRPLKFKEISVGLGVSVKYLSCKFKRELGLTFLEALNRRRIYKAIELMKTGEYNVNQIADKTGFSDYKHFHAVFKKHLGIAPSEFWCK